MKKIKYIMAIAALSGCLAAGAANPGDAPAPAPGTGQDSVVYLPLNRTVAADQRTGSTLSLNGAQIGKYPSLDIRNQMTGLIPGLDVVETDGSTGISITSTSALLYARRQGIQYIVDDVPVYITQLQLDPEEIESATLLTDIADKAQFGPTAANGVLYIRTKRAQVGPTSVKLNFERGVSIVDRFPGWVRSTDYAKMNNAAREADNMTPLYDDDAINGYRMRNPNSMEYPNANFRSMMFKDTKPYTRAGLDIDGGTAAVRYNAHIGYAGEGDIYKIGPTSNYNRLNVRTNIDATITKRLKVNVNFFGGMTFRALPKYGFGTTNADEMTAILADLRTIPSNSFPVYVTPETQDEGVEAGKTIYAVSNRYPNNPVAALAENGNYTTKGRTGMINTRIDYDCSSFVKGLKSTTFLNLNVYSMTRIGKNPDYVAYLYDPTSASLNALSSHKGEKVSDKSLMDKYTYQSLNFYEQLSYNREWNCHKLGASATYYLSSVSFAGKSSYERQQNAIGVVSYSYGGRYLAEAVVNYAGSSRFVEGRRYEAFPSLGLGWVASKEAFLKEVSWIDLLKVRGQAGILGYEDFGDQFYYESYYQKASGPGFGPAPSNQWFGTATVSMDKTSLSRLGNPDLTWEKCKELSAGVDAQLFGRRLELSATYFLSKHDGIITQINTTTPLYYGQRNTSIYRNFNASLRRGVELALSYGGRVRDFGYRVGGSLVWSDAEYTRYNEVYTYDYQAVQGTPLDAYRGYVYIGKFASDEEIAASPIQTFDEQLQVGDLKYADLNGDGRIDANDQQVIGHTTPRLTYAANIYLQYKWLDLTIVGTGRAGYKIPFTNAWFWNGWGDENYSKFVRNNAGGDYPRQTYNKVNNNFLNSSYWLRDGGFFKIQNVELGFNAPFHAGNKAGIKKLRVFARCANLLTISKVKDVDPESVDSGVTTYPLFRTFTGGINIKF